MFFDGMLADETSQIRLVGFQGMQQRKLNNKRTYQLSLQIVRYNLLIRVRGAR